jgi:hypothetical protein
VAIKSAAFRNEAAEGGLLRGAPVVGGAQVFRSGVEVRLVLGVVDARDGRVVVRPGGADEQGQGRVLFWLA